MISIVIPLHNEDANLAELYRRLSGASVKWAAPFEVIFVDDGSTDGTSERCQRLCLSDAKFRLICLSRRFGHQAAICAGLADARGDQVVVMDGDLQDPPEVIEALLGKLDEGFDVAYAVRRKRKEPPWKRLLYFLFYRLLRRVSDLDIPLDAGDFCAMNARVVHALNALPEGQKFIRGLRAWVGFRQIGIPYERAGRGSGSSKYHWAALVRLALQGLFGFSRNPCPRFLAAGAACLVAAIPGAVLVVPHSLLNPGCWPTSLVLGLGLALSLMWGGTLLLCMGVVTGYLHSILEQTRGRPTYVVRDRFGFGEEGGARTYTGPGCNEIGRTP